jgi:hypothetical protein
LACSVIVEPSVYSRQQRPEEIPNFYLRRVDLVADRRRVSCKQHFSVAVPPHQAQLVQHDGKIYAYGGLQVRSLPTNPSTPMPVSHNPWVACLPHASNLSSPLLFALATETKGGALPALRTQHAAAKVEFAHTAARAAARRRRRPGCRQRLSAGCARRLPVGLWRPHADVSGPDPDDPQILFCAAEVTHRQP